MTEEGPSVIIARTREELIAIAESMANVREARRMMDDPALRRVAMDSAALNLHDLYVGLERLFETIARSVDESRPSGRSWHRDLLEQMTLELPGRRPRVIDRGLYADLSHLLRFRHVVRNVYAHELEHDNVVLNVDRAERVYSVRSLEPFADWLDSLERF